MTIDVRILLCGVVLLLTNCGKNSKLDNIQSERQQLDSLYHYYKIGNMKKCIEKAKLFSSKYPYNDSGLQVLGSAYLYLNQDSLAEFYTKKAFNLNSNNSSTLTNIAILLDKKGNYNKAQYYYKKAITINPDFAQAYSNYAANRLFVGDYKTAIFFGKKAISLADNIKDKSILCVSYDRAKMLSKRDSVYNELQKLHYSHLKDLKEVFQN